MKDGYYDVHIHLLPGIDDGADSMETTRQMLEKAYEQGVRFLIATPHYISGRTADTKAERKQLLEQVKALAKTVAPDLEVDMGNELYYSESIFRDLAEERAATLCDSDYVLVEFAVNVPYKELYHAMRRFVEASYRPVLAHVERYECLYKQEQRISDLISLGTYIQMNTQSLIGGFMDTRASYCRRLLMQGQVHLLGSDAHGILRRPPLMRDAVRILERKGVPEPLLERILYRNPQRIIENKYI